ncbi:MAG: hypothetical protein ACJ76P_06270 [Actinomycetota bacterium]
MAGSGTSFAEALTQEKTAKRPHRDVAIVLDSAVSDRLDAFDRRIAETRAEIAVVDEQEEDLDGELEEVKQSGLRMADVRPKEIEERRALLDVRRTELVDAIGKLEEERAEAARGTYWTFRFVQLPGPEWAEITFRNPPRPDIAIDVQYGYNYHSVARAAAAQSGAVLHRETAEDGTETERLEKLSPEQWADLWVALSGRDFERIASNVWDLNEYGPQRRLEAAGKAFRVGTGSRSS